MDTRTIQLSPSVFELVASNAAQHSQTPDAFVERLLSEQLKPQHPYIVTVRSRSGLRAMIHGTKIGVDVIVRYRKVGHSPEEIANDILPDLSLSQVYDALGYYDDNRNEMEAEFAEHTPDV